MKLTVGLPAFKCYPEVWFTVQALRMYHDLRDAEVLVLDNAGDDQLARFVSGFGRGEVRYVRYTDRQSPSHAKNAVFREARGEWVICLDAHVLLVPGALAAFRSWADANRDCRDLLHGPLVYDDLVATADAMNDEWGTDGKWGTWRTRPVSQYAEPYEIPMHGCGLMACRRDAWLPFPSAWRGFAGEEGYIHAKYRKAGRRVLLLPFLRWVHLFRADGSQRPYQARTTDIGRNYAIGLRELGLDLAPVTARYGNVHLPLPLLGTAPSAK